MNTVGSRDRSRLIPLSLVDRVAAFVPWTPRSMGPPCSVGLARPLTASSFDLGECHMELAKKKEKSHGKEELNGTNSMGQTGFCERLRFPASFCENLRFPAVCCGKLRLRNAVIPRKGENLQKISENLRKAVNLAPFVPFSLSLGIPLDMGAQFLIIKFYSCGVFDKISFRGNTWWVSQAEAWF